MFNLLIKKSFQLSTTIFSLMITQLAFAQTEGAAAPTAGPQQPPGWMQFVPFAVILVVFYFFLIRPQAKKQREQQNFLQALKVGDLIVTQSGLFGKITGLNEQIANLEIAQGVQIKILRHQIIMLQSALQKAGETKA
ncbi:MAG: preprotein translocase subunit YajC [Pseudobdellovibrio sp.]